MKRMSISICMLGISLSTGIGAVQTNTDIDSVLSATVEELADILGETSIAGYDWAYSLKADAMRLTTDWKMAKTSMLCLESLQSWREEFRTFRNEALTHAAWFAGGGTTWGHAMSAEALKTEEFIAEWAVELSDLGDNTRKVTYEGKLIEDAWNFVIQTLYDDVGFVDEEQGRPFYDNEYLKRWYRLPSWKLVLLFERLKSDRAKQAVIAFLRHEPWSKTDIGESIEIPAQGNCDEKNSISNSQRSFPLYGIVHHVGVFDSLESIAEEYHSKVEWIVEANKEDWGFELKVGSKIFVPINQ